MRYAVIVSTAEIGPSFYANAQAIRHIGSACDALKRIHMEVIDTGRAIREYDLFIVGVGLAAFAHRRIALPEGLKVFTAK